MQDLVSEYYEYSRAMVELMETAREVAKEIIELVPVGVSLPRRYMVVARDVWDVSSTTVYQRLFLVKYYYEKDVDKQIWVNGVEGMDYIPPLKEDGALEFAIDIMDGLRDDFSACLNDRKNRAIQLTSVLREVTAKRL